MIGAAAVRSFMGNGKPTRRKLSGEARTSAVSVRNYHVFYRRSRSDTASKRHVQPTATDGCRRETMRLGQNNCGLAGRCRAQCRENPLLVLPNIFRAARSTQVLSGIKDRRGSRKRLRVILQIGSRNEELV